MVEDGIYWVVCKNDDPKDKKYWEIKELYKGRWYGFAYEESDEFDEFIIVSEKIEP